eukprot:2078178-Prymnesium_polylepis.2
MAAAAAAAAAAAVAAAVVVLPARELMAAAACAEAAAWFSCLRPAHASSAWPLLGLVERRLVPVPEREVEDESTSEARRACRGGSRGCPAQQGAAWLRELGSGTRGCRVQGSGCRVQGAGWWHLIEHGEAAARRHDAHRPHRKVKALGAI